MNRQLFASLFCSVFVCVACSGAYAGDAAGDDRKVDCNDATSTYEINECSEREFEAADKALNDIYGQAIAYIKKSESEAPYDAKRWEAALRASQRSWVAFRDADCKDLVPFSWTGGTGTTAAVVGCMSEKTKARTQEIKELYEPN